MLTQPVCTSSAPGVPVCIGVDIANATCEACVWRASGKTWSKSFPNDASGFAKMQRWIAALASHETPHYCMEAPGNSYLACAFFLAEAEPTVSGGNPFRIKQAGLVYGQGNKTDKAEARTLAQYGRKEPPRPKCAPAAPEVRTRRALLRRIDTLQAPHVAEPNRLQDPGLLDMGRASIVSRVDFLASERARLYRRVREPIDQPPPLKADRELLQRLPGVGESTAPWLLAELPDGKQFASAQDAAAFAGLNPGEYRWGSRVKKKTRLSTRGSVSLRKCLYMPALTAKRFNPCLAALWQRLQQRGLAKQAIVAAAMRKLLMLAYGVLRNQQKFDSEWTGTRPTPDARGTGVVPTPAERELSRRPRNGSCPDARGTGVVPTPAERELSRRPRNGSCPDARGTGVVPTPAERYASEEIMPSPSRRLPPPCVNRRTGSGSAKPVLPSGRRKGCLRPLPALLCRENAVGKRC